MKEKRERALKRKCAQAVQRATPLRSRFSVQPYYFVAACACLAERVSAPPLVYDKHTPRCQTSQKKDICLIF